MNHAEIEDFIEECISVDGLQIYKPAPQVYRLGMERVGVEEPNEILFVSANGWDIAGAGAFGFQTAWINRAGVPVEQLPTKPTYVMKGVEDITGYLEKKRNQV